MTLLALLLVVGCGEECDPLVFPYCVELCDGADDDLDGEVDEGCVDGECDWGTGHCAAARLVGSPESRTGYRVLATPDVTGDEVPDLLVMSPREVPLPGDPTGDRVAVRVVSGATRGTHDLTLAPEIRHAEPREGLTSMAAAGDTNGNGVADLLLALPRGGYAVSEVYLFLGPIGDPVDTSIAHARFTIDGNDRLGAAMAGAGDVNGDGLDDLLLGAPGAVVYGDKDAGAAYLILGPVDGGANLDPGREDAARILGENQEHYLGSAVAGADLDGDGLSDLVVGVPGEDQGDGTVRVFLSPVSGDTLAREADVVLDEPDQTSDLGEIVAAGEDLDGDGYLDLATSALGTRVGLGYNGTVLLLHGRLTGGGDVPADAWIVGEADGDDVGASLALIPDLDGDGTAEVVAGAYRYSEYEPSGAVWVFDGITTGTWSLDDAEQKLTGAAEGDFLGGSVAAVPDTDGDGYPELLIGAEGASLLGRDGGMAILVLGGP